MSKKRLKLAPSEAGNRLRCTCGGTEFFIGSEPEEQQPLDTFVVGLVECVKCHVEHRLAIELVMGA